jgi:hypothetical protein
LKYRPRVRRPFLQQQEVVNKHLAMTPVGIAIFWVRRSPAVAGRSLLCLYRVHASRDERPKAWRECYLPVPCRVAAAPLWSVDAFDTTSVLRVVRLPASAGGGASFASEDCSRPVRESICCSPPAPAGAHGRSTTMPPMFSIHAADRMG